MDSFSYVSKVIQFNINIQCMWCNFVILYKLCENVNIQFTSLDYIDHNIFEHMFKNNK
jgi:hypothetical protein